MPKKAIQATISAGESLSGSIDLTSDSLAMLLAPSAWTSANLSFLVSTDNVNFVGLYDASGAEVVKPIVPNTAVNVPTEITQAAVYLKLRSGTRMRPVPQQQAATFALVLI
jgi:hypothetical protein